MYLEKVGKPCKKAVFMLLFPREIQGIKWKMVIFCSDFSVFDGLVNKGTIS